MRNLSIGETLILAIIIHAFVLPTFVLAEEPVEIIAAESETIQHVDKLLTLKGLRLIYAKNRPA